MNSPRLMSPLPSRSMFMLLSCACVTSMKWIHSRCSSLPLNEKSDIHARGVGNNLWSPSKASKSSLYGFKWSGSSYASRRGFMIISLPRLQPLSDSSTTAASAGAENTSDNILRKSIRPSTRHSTLWPTTYTPTGLGLPKYRSNVQNSGFDQNKTRAWSTAVPNFFNAI